MEGMTEVLGSLFWYLITIGLLVTFHEFGHFWVARRCGVKVHRFSIGFGRPLWSRFGRDGTEYVLASIPLGGYVSMLDERAEDVAPEQLHAALNRKPVWQKILVAAAGPIANVLLAIAAFWLLFVVGQPDHQPLIGNVSGLSAEAGLPTRARVLRAGDSEVSAWSEVGNAVYEGAIYRRDVSLTTRDEQGRVATHLLRLSSIPADVHSRDLGRFIGLGRFSPAIAGPIDPDQPAAKAGMQEGDRILAINGRAVADFNEVFDAVQEFGPAGALRVRVQRGAEQREFEVVPGSREFRGKTYLAMGVSESGLLLRYGPLEAIPHALHETWAIAAKSVQFLKDMLIGALSTENISGPITIAQVANISANEGLPWFLGFLGAVSLGLAILNLLPIPILDGGHILYYLIELIKGSPVSERTLVAGQYVGLVMLSGLIGLAFFNDISGLFR
jgi:regulator of sigma E protease